jgi:hypothetical protein
MKCDQRLKKGGLLERAMCNSDSDGLCRTCGNLVKISDAALGCATHDKFILPDFMPYHSSHNKCRDWQKGAEPCQSQP